MSQTIESTNPATGETLKSYPVTSEEETAAIVDRAAEAFDAWRRVSFADRAKCMMAAAAAFDERAPELAGLMADEMGKPVGAGRDEAQKCARAFRYYAENAEGQLSPEAVETEASRSYVAFEPLGILLAVMPWNYPLWQVVRAAAPALMAGNAVLLKHAANVPGCALAIEEILHGAGVPKHLFRTLLIKSDAVAGLLENDKVRAATLTGSVPAGRAVAAKAGEQLKPTVLELGGSDPYLVLEDADLAHAAEVCVKSRLLNTGQSCIAAKRFIVVEDVADRFTELVVAEMKKRNVGPPRDEDTDLGPMARADLRDELHEQVEKSVAQGAKAVLGGERPDGPGAFYPPTVLTGVEKGMPAHDEELFGPVAAVIRAADSHDAIRIANDSPFGLGAAVFTQDAARGEQIARRELAAGCCFVNDFVRSDPRLPFGGIKDSGYGRELSHFGIREFVNTKTVYVK